MTHSAPSIGHETVLLPNQPFFSWLRSQTTLFVSQIFALLSFVSFVASLTYYVFDVAEKGSERSVFSLAKINAFIDIAHIVLIMIFIIAIIQVLDDNVRGSYRVGLVYTRVFGKALREEQHHALLDKSKDGLRWFKICFLCFWCVMLALYIAFAFKHTLGAPPKAASAGTESHKQHAGSAEVGSVSNHERGPEPAPPVQGAKTLPGTETVEPDGSGHLNIANPANSLPAASPTGTQPPKKPPPPPDLLKDKLFPFLTFALNNVSLMFVFWCFAGLYLPSHKGRHWLKPPAVNRFASLTTLSKRMHRWYWRSNRRRQPYLLSSLFIAILTLSYLPLFASTNAETLRTYQAGFDALSGTLNALVLALLIARMDSKLIGLPSWLIFVLYSYAAVQPLFVVFEQDTEVFNNIQTAVLIVVFIFKIYFFLIIFYTLQTGRMLNYLYCFPFLSCRVNKLEENKISIRLGNIKPVARRIIGVLFGHLGQEQLRRMRKAIGIWSLGCVIAFLVCRLIVHWKVPIAEVKALLVNVDFINLFVIGVIILILSSMLSHNSQGRERAETTYLNLFGVHLTNPDAMMKITAGQLRQFKKYFLWFWSVMWVLYVALLLRHAGLNADPLEGDPQLTTIQVIKLVAHPFAEFTLSTVNLICIFCCFVVLYLPAYDVQSERRQHLVVRYSRFVVALLVATFLLLICAFGPGRLTAANLEIHKTVFNGLSGTLSVIALALLIARLDSKIISLSSWLICLLFIYSSVQALSVVFDLKSFQGIETATLIAALIFKICFFLIVTYTLQTGKLLNYLVCFPLLDKRVDAIFDNQFEIRTRKTETHEFTFSIWKNNQLMYSTESTFKAKTDCDRAVENLRNIIKHNEEFKPHNTCGTHWVRVDDISRGVLCESISLRSREDADHLITESIEKIPYCKYDRG